MAAASETGRPATPPRVVCIEWIEPLMAAGNWTPELIELAGGVNLFGEAGKHSPWMTWDQLAAADPDVLIIAPCGFDLARTGQEMYWLTDRPGWRELRAVRTHRVYLADGTSISIGPARVW
jgi:iron complex transport system substrate-binding protein